MPHVTVSREIGGRTLTIETGLLAKQAAGAAMVRYGDTCVFAACVSDKPRPGIDFFPLQVDYREKLTAGGKFPGGFFKREGRPTNKEILTARLIDRPTRPLFPEGYNDDLQVHVVVHSCDEVNDPDVIGMIAASAALHVSPLPWQGPTGAVRVGLVDGTLVLNPTPEQLETSDLSLVVAGTAEHITMVEAGANEVTEPQMLEALQTAHRAIREIVSAIEELARKTGRQKVTYTPPAHDRALMERVKSGHYADLLTRIQTPLKFERRDKLSEWKKAVKAAFAKPELTGDAATAHAAELGYVIATLVEQGFRELIMRGVRCDGRPLDAVRPIECRVGLFPRTHGSALFTRGETQALVTCTLGSVDDEQRIDGLFSEYREKFMLHYNFPSYSVGETKPIRGPGRREIGHGALAQRALEPALPDYERFPYTIRVVSDILESNGSSSMASVCGGTLAMLHAGVPLRAPVAGIAMGLVVEDGKSAILSDILGDEDHYGEMDFKVCGTANGITALQMDIKNTGISPELMTRALEQAHAGRLHILREMAKTITAPAPMSQYAPRHEMLMIDPEKIGLIIGPGGKNIRKIQEDTETEIDIDDDGRVVISGYGDGNMSRALAIIKGMTTTPTVGSTYKGKVVSVRDFGAFVEFLPGQEGLVHVSELDVGYVEHVDDVVKVGDEIDVRIISVDDTGRVKLSRKAVLDPDGTKSEAARGPRGDREGGGFRGGRDRDRDRGGRDRDRGFGGGGGGGGGRDRDRGGRGREDRGFGRERSERPDDRPRRPAPPEPTEDEPSLPGVPASPSGGAEFPGFGGIRPLGGGQPLGGAPAGGSAAPNAEGGEDRPRRRRRRGGRGRGRRHEGGTEGGPGGEAGGEHGGPPPAAPAPAPASQPEPPSPF